MQNLESKVFHYGTLFKNQIKAGWIVNLILLIMLGYAIYVFVERFFSFKKSNERRKKPSRCSYWTCQREQLSSAKETCRRSKESPIAKMLLRGISLYEKGDV